MDGNWFDGFDWQAALAEGAREAGAELAARGRSPAEFRRPGEHVATPRKRDTNPTPMIVKTFIELTRRQRLDSVDSPARLAHYLRKTFRPA